MQRRPTNFQHFVVGLRCTRSHPTPHFPTFRTASESALQIVRCYRTICTIPTKSLVKTPKLHFRDTGPCAFLMGIVSRGHVMNSPLAGGLWESMVGGDDTIHGFANHLNSRLNVQI